METHLSHHVKIMGTIGVVSLFQLVKGPFSALWADRVEQENLEKAQENIQLMELQLHQHEPEEVHEAGEVSEPLEVQHVHVVQVEVHQVA